MMEIQRMNIAIPATEENAIELLVLLAQIKEYEKQMKDAQKILKEKYTEVENKIRIYYEGQLVFDPKFKIKSDNGNISKSNTSKWFYDDEKSIINQLKSLEPSLVRTKEEIDKAKLKKMCEVTDDGEVILNDELLDNIRVEKVENISIKPK